MKDGRITQDGKYNDILKSGSDFMELVGAHKEALSALDSIEAGAAVVGEDSSTGNAKNFLQKKESPTDQNDKTDNAMGTNGQLIQAVGIPVYTRLCPGPPIPDPSVMGGSKSRYMPKLTRVHAPFILLAPREPSSMDITSPSCSTHN
ncbi:Peptide exporter [Forsythia ovata]|uniref:Peptide exporter n=1 Tax=Forsythia ovata TaxID=205694 RepID=A0ABD1WAI0_9LAMI